MSKLRLILTIFGGLGILFAISLISVDPTLLIEQGAKSLSKRIFEDLKSNQVYATIDFDSLVVEGAAKHRSKALLASLKATLETKNESEIKDQRRLLSSHLRFVHIAGHLKVKGYHQVRLGHSQLEGPSAFNATLKALGIDQKSPNMAFLPRGNDEFIANYRRQWQKLTTTETQSDPLLKGAQSINVTIAANGQGQGELTIDVLIESKPKPWRLPGTEALVPPIIALLIAIGFRRIIPALLLAVLCGGAIQETTNPLWAAWHEISGFFKALIRLFGGEATAPKGYIGPVLDDAFNLQILGFTFVLVGMIAIVNRMGGTGGLVGFLSRFVRGPKSAQAVTAVTGTALFFDDYANTVVVGTSGRSITDKFKISREKLAYIVDSTSAPVAGVALLSTWIGYEVGLFDDLLSHLPKESGFPTNGYGLFLAALPYRFYCFFALMLVFVVAATGRDFGPMLHAERSARRAETVQDEHGRSETLEKDGVPLRAYNALIPIVVVLLSILALVLNAAPKTISSLFSLDGLRQAFGNGDLDLAELLFISALVGAGTSAVLALLQRLLNLREIAAAFASGVQGLWGAGAVLVLAWAIKQVCDDLGTGSVILAVMGDQLPATALPVIIFLLSGVIGFSTGTSWGTMALMLPIAAPLSVEISGDTVVVLASLAAVLDGAIWGDHCSPISDTTVLSSASAGCPHLDHVKTQIPYAMLAMFAACLTGYLWITTVEVYVMCLPLGLGLMVGFMYIFGKDPSRSAAKIGTNEGL